MTKSNLYPEGISKHPAYGIWRDIVHRTENPKSPKFHRYGGRGIKLFPPWREDSELFISYITELDGWGDPKKTLDRMDNDKGYEPGNLRFVSHYYQMANTRKTKSSRSEYTGVYLHKATGKWVAQITVGGKRRHLKLCPTEVKAAQVRDAFVIENGIDAPLNLG